MKLLSLSNTDKGVKGEYFNENFEAKVPFYIGSFTSDLQELWNTINIKLNEAMNFGLENQESPQHSFFHISKISYSYKKKEYTFSGTCRRNLYSYSDATNYTIQSEIEPELLMQNVGKAKGRYLTICSELGGLVDLLLTSFEPSAYVDILPIDSVEERNLFSDLPNSASNE